MRSTRRPAIGSGRRTSKAPSTLSRRARASIPARWRSVCTRLTRLYSSIGSFVARASSRARHYRLIETSLAFARRVQRNRNDQISFSQRRALLRLPQCFKQPTRHVWLTFQRQDRSAQSAFVQSAGARAGETVCVTSSTANRLPLLFRNCARYLTRRISSTAYHPHRKFASRPNTSNKRLHRDANQPMPPHAAHLCG